MRKFFERFTYGITVLSVIFWSLGPAAFPLPVHAIATTQVFPPETPLFGMKANSGLKAAVKIQFGADANGQNLNQIFTGLVPVGGNPVFTNGSATSSNLADFSTSTASGISLWKDVAKNGFTGAGDDVNVLLYDMPYNYVSPGLVGIATIPLTPSTSTPITTDDIFYIALQTHATPVHQNAFKVKLIQSSIVAGPAALTTNLFETQPISIDTSAPTITSFNGSVGTTGAQLRFNESVQKVGGGNITFVGATDPFTYVDAVDGDPAATVSGVAHTAGQDIINLTFSRNITSNDLVNTIAPAANKIMDMAGNVAATSTLRTMTNPIQITTPNLPIGSASSTYTTTLIGSGGMGAKAWSAVAAEDSTTLTNLGLTLNPVSGVLSGTIPNTTYPRNYSVNLKYRDNVTTATVTTGAVGANPWTVTAGNFTPALGDIVLYRATSTTTPAWGIVTALSDGDGTKQNTFKINNQVLDATTSYQITKLYVSTATSAIANNNIYTQGLNFAVGDIAFYPANANGTGYTWGLVTTAANIAPGAGPGLLQINNAVAPTYTVAGQITKITPFVTSNITVGAAGANPWTANSGSYTPAYGDLVLYRNITDAPTVVNWGIVNQFPASTAQNVFKINEQTLIAIKNYQISKVASIQQAGFDGFSPDRAFIGVAAMDFSEGDILFAPTDNATTTANYGWAFLTGGAGLYQPEGPGANTFTAMKLNGSATGVSWLGIGAVAKLSPTATSATSSLRIGVGGIGGGAIPDITGINPDIGVVSSTVNSITVTGLNTHFSPTSTVEFLSGQSVISSTSTQSNNTIYVSNVSSTGPTNFSFRAVIGSAVAQTRYDIRITSGNEIVFRPNGFGINGALQGGLSLLAPSGSGSVDPRFSFGESTVAGVNWYRLTVRTSSDFAAASAPTWDYVFPKTGTICDTQMCNVPWRDTLKYTLTAPPPLLSINTTYFWRVQTYGLSVTSTPSSFAAAVPLETSSAVSFQTAASLNSDQQPPNIEYQPVMQAASSTNLDMIARVTDDGGPTLLQTKLFYCNGSGCNPTTEAAAPTSLGNGYFKYRIPSATIGVANTITQYYISATDGSSNTNTSKALTGNNPHTITSGDAGASTITGIVRENDGTQNGTCSAGVQGATLFASGTGLSTTTGGDCTFTLANVPLGRSYMLRAFKDGYFGPDISAFPGSANIAIKLNTGSGGGLGGDTTRPHIDFTMPGDLMTLPVGGQTGFRVVVAFDKTMSLDNNSVKASGNFTIRDATANLDITSKGVWTYYAANPNIQGLPPHGNLAVWTLSGTNTLGDNKKIIVSVSPTITDTALNPLEGRMGFSFTTGASLGTQTFDAGSGMFSGGGAFGVGANMQPIVNYLSVAPGSTNVPRNAKVTITFSEPMASDGGGYVLKNSIKLYTVNGDTETDVSSAMMNTVVLDSSLRNATINLSGDGLFTAGATYRIKILGAAKAASGMTMRQPGEESQVAYPENKGQTDFTIGSTSESGNLALDTISVAQNAVGIKPLASFSMTFDRDIDPSTLTTNNISLTVGSTRVEGAFSYDPSMNKATFIPREALAPNTSYTMTLGTGIKSLNTGSALATASTRTFTTGAADTTAPKIMSVRADDYRIAIFFSKPMNAVGDSTDANWATSVLNPSAYHVVKYGAAGFNTAAGTAIDLTAAGVTFSYTAMENKVEIRGLNMRSALGQEIYVSTDIAGTPVGDANIPRDISGNAISATANSARSRIEDSAATMGNMELFAAPTPMTVGMAMNFSTDQFAYAPTADALPAFNTLQDQTTVYHIRIPVSKQIPADGSIVLVFDQTFNVTGAKQDVNSFMMNDMNGPRPGTVRLKCSASSATKICPTAGGATVTSDSAGAGDAGTRGGVADDGIIVENDYTLRVYLATATDIDATTGKENDILEFDLDGIRSSSVPGKYTVNIQPKKADGTSATEPAFQSGEFTIQKLVTGSAYTVSGTITATGNTQAGTASVFLKALGSPLAFNATTANFTDAGAGDGDAVAAYSFSNIPAGDYMLAMPRLVTIGNAEFSGKFQQIKVSANTVQNMTIESNTSGGTNVTVNITGGAALAGEALDVFADSGFTGRKKQVTLDGAGAGTVTLNLTNGSWNVGMGPQMTDGFTPQNKKPNYFPPQPIFVTVNGATVTETSGTTANDGILAATLQALSASGRTIKGVMRSASGANLPMAGIRVKAYSPNMGYTYTETDANGKFTLDVLEGTYSVGAFADGMQGSADVPVTVQSTGNLIIPGITTSAAGITPDQATTQFIIKMNRPPYSITGRITKDGIDTNGLSDVSMYAYREGGFGDAHDMTDSAGDYELLVDSGIWKIGGYIRGYGELTEQTIVVGTQSVSGKNFQARQSGSNYFSVSGRVYNDTNGNTTWDSGEEEKNTFVTIFSGAYSSETQTKDDGTYTLSNIPSANGYQLRATDVNRTDLGTLAAFNVTADVANKDFRLSARRTVTVTFSSAVNKIGINLSDATTGIQGQTFVERGTSASLSLPDGSYAARIDTQETPISSAMISATDGNTTWNSNTGVVTVNGNEGLTVTLPTLRTVAGTVTDGTIANTAKDAWVEIVNPTTGFHRGTQASNGVFTLQAPDAVGSSYFIEAKKLGFFHTASALTINGANPIAQTLTMTAGGATIEGTVTAGTSAGAYAYVIAEKQGGGFAKTEADGAGNYKLPVTAGTWFVSTGVAGYQEAAFGASNVNTRGTSIEVSSNSGATTGKNITLSTTRTMAVPFSKPFDRTAGGTMKHASTGSGVVFPANALPKGNDVIKVDMTERPAPRTSTAIPVGSKGVEYKATDTTGKEVATMNDNLTVEMCNTIAELAATPSATDSSINTLTEANTLKPAYDKNGSWEILSGSSVVYKDATGAAVASPTASLDNVTRVCTKGPTKHFSLYATVVSTDPSAPATPTGAGVGSATVSALTISWTAVVGATSYDVYRSTSADGTFTRLGSEPTVSSGATTSYQDTGLTAGTTYYYKVSALNLNGESAASSAVSAATATAASQAGAVIVVNTAQQNQQKTTIETKKTEEAVKTEVKAPAATSEKSAASAEAQKSLEEKSLSNSVIEEKVVKTLVKVTAPVAMGAKSAAAKTVQEVLKAEGLLAKPSGRMDKATIDAIKKFQEEHDIAKKGVPGYGTLGPKTRAAINAIITEQKSLVAQTAKESMPPVSANVEVQVKPLPSLSAKAAKVVTSVLQQSAIIILPQDHGKAYYLDPKTQKRSSLGRPAEAFSVMRSYGIGITNKDLARIPESTKQGDTTFGCKHAGKIFLQVQEHGEAWYVHPKDCKRYFLGKPTDAFTLMRTIALGVSNADAALIPRFTQGPAVASSETAKTVTAFPTLYRSLVNGMKGDDVKTLQTVLSNKGFYYGDITGVMDEETFDAVRDFQLEQEIADEDTPGFGTVGPATRAAINKMIGK